MGLFDHFPYTNVHELNLDWILSMMKALEAEWEAFIAGNSLTFADPLQHDISKTYAKNTIVLDNTGNAYLSLQAVPVGVSLSNQDYWLMVFDYEAFIEKVNKNFTARYYRNLNKATTAIAIGDWLTLDDVLYKATAAISIGDTLEDGVNITHFTLEDFINEFMQSADNRILQMYNDFTAAEAQHLTDVQAEIDRILAGATVDSEVIDARLGANGYNYSTLGSAIRSQIGELDTDIQAIIDGFATAIYPWAPTTNHPTGWRSGYWDDSGTGQSSVNYIRTALRYGNPNSNYPIYDSAFAFFTYPSAYSMVIKIYDYDTSTLLNRYDFHGGFGLMPMQNNTRIGIYMYDFAGDAATYADDQTFIDQIKFYYVKKPLSANPRTDEFMHFTVKSIQTWPDVTDTTSGDNDSYSEVDTLCVLTLPTSYSPNGKPTPLIMFGHGHNCQITNSSWYGNNANFLAMIRAFTAAGYAVFDVNNSHDDSDGYPDWGCLPLMTSYIRAWEYIKQNYNVEDKLYLLSDSMGTMANLNMMKWYSGNIVTSIMTAPRPVVKDVYESYTGDEKTKMATAFGLSSATWEDERLKGFDAYQNIVDISGTGYVFENFPPVKVLVGTGDSNFLTETRAYFEALNNAGNFVNYREVSGATHAQMSFLSIGDLVDECINWFNRFKN